MENMQMRAYTREQHKISVYKPKYIDMSCGARYIQCQAYSPHTSLLTLHMPADLPRLIELLEIPLLLRAQNLSPHGNRLVHPLHAAKPDDRARDPLVDPRQRHLAHLPAVLLRKLLYARNGLEVYFRRADSVRCLIVDRPRCATVRRGGAGKVAAAERCPLKITGMLALNLGGEKGGGSEEKEGSPTGIRPTPVALQ